MSTHLWSLPGGSFVARPHFICAALVGLVLTSAPTAATEPAPRLLRMDDLFAQQVVDPATITWSLDGRSFAVVIARPLNTLPPPVQSSWWINEAGYDVWVQAAPGQLLVNVTDGQGDASGWWNPQWSPDSRSLAMFSTRGGLVTLWVWGKSGGKLRQVSREGVLTKEIWPSSRFAGTRSFAWVDDRRLLCLLPAEGTHATPWDSLIGRTIDSANVGWERARRGEATGSAIDSTEFVYPEGRLFLVDANSGAGRVLARTTLNNTAF